MAVAVRLTQEQQETVKQMMELSGIFADQLLHIMRNHGIDKYDGSQLTIFVNSDPEREFVNNMVIFGKPDTEAGKVSISNGKHNKEYQLIGKNSAEYEYLFASEEVKRQLRERKPAEKPLPPDGLWISSYDDVPDVGDQRGVEK